MAYHLHKRRSRAFRLVIVALLGACSIGAWDLLHWPPIRMDRLMRIAPLYQSDYTEVLAVIGGEKKTVHSSGCGAVCVAMAVNYLTGANRSPNELFKWAVDEGYYTGDGLSHQSLSKMAEHCGARGEWVKNEPGPVLSALGEGYPVVAHVGAGTFTKGGHYILLIGLAGDGKVIVNDPGSRKRSGQAFDLSLIISELRRENSFMIVKPWRGFL